MGLGRCLIWRNNYSTFALKYIPSNSQTVGKNETLFFRAICVRAETTSGLTNYSLKEKQPISTRVEEKGAEIL
jgi:hypothetical protein